MDTLIDRLPGLAAPLVPRGHSLALALALALALVGLACAARLLSRLLRFAWLYLLRPSGLGRYLHAGPDGGAPWALVTGASDGIGRHLARELAGRGFDVVLHGRNPAKLAGVRDALAAAFPGRRFRVLVADASAMPCAGCCGGGGGGGGPGGGTWEKDEEGGTAPSAAAAAAAAPAPVDLGAIAASLSDLHLTVLINNAGGGNTTPPILQFLQDTPYSKLVSTASLNALFPLGLMSALLPRLIASSPALIVNISSLADVGVPMLGSYGPSKALLVSASVTLSRELRMQEGPARDVEVLAVRVGTVCGTGVNSSTPSLLVPDARTMARAVLDRIGCGRAVVVGYFWHKILITTLTWMPEWMMDAKVRNAIRKREASSSVQRGTKKA